MVAGAGLQGYALMQQLQARLALDTGATGSLGSPCTHILSSPTLEDDWTIETRHIAGARIAGKCVSGIPSHIRAGGVIDDVQGFCDGQGHLVGGAGGCRHSIQQRHIHTVSATVDCIRRPALD